MSARAEGERIARLLMLQRLPEEGGLFRRTYADAHSSVIYFMLLAPDFSALHALDGVETYHWYAGSPLQLLLHPGGQVEQPVLGPDLAVGARPQIVVPTGVWQGSSPLGEWTLAGTTMAPAFEWSAFHLGRRAELLAGWPHAAPRIRALTRTRASQAQLPSWSSLPLPRDPRPAESDVPGRGERGVRAHSGRGDRGGGRQGHR